MGDSLLEKSIDTAHDDASDFEAHSHHSKRNSYRIWQIPGVIMVGLLAIIGLVTVVQTIQHHHFNPGSINPYKSMTSEYYCGSTIEDALAMGCKFDVGAEPDPLKNSSTSCHEQLLTA